MTAIYLPARWLITTADGVDDPDVFPLIVGQNFLVSKRPTWSTGIATAISGRERRRKLWSYPKWQFKVSYEVLRDLPSTPDLQRLLAFFNAHAGRFGTFYFLDPTDNAVSNETFGVGDGITTTFQLTRTIGVGGIAFTEPVGGVTGAPTVTINGATTTAFTIGANGSITFTSAPAAAASLAWSGRFLFACRFDQDDMDLAQMMTALWSLDGLAFLTVKA